MAAGRRLTRRTLLERGAAGFALAPSLARAAAGPPPPPAENIQGASDDADRLTVETHIDGKGPFRFLVDTGTDRTIVADDVAAAFGQGKGEPVIVQGITSATPAETVRLRNLSFGSIQLDSLEAPVLPREALRADGYLGLDAVHNLRVAFDFQHHRLTVERSFPNWLPERRRDDEALVPVDGRSGRLTSVDCHVDGVRAHAFIDSGAEITIGNSRLFAELQQKVAKTYQSDKPIMLTGVTSGTALGRLTAIDRVRLGALNFSDSILVISDLPIFDVWGLSDEPAMFIGMNFLKRTSSLTIDYGRRELRFKVAQVRIASRG